ncbi:MAG: zinc ribbon domain-containing protein [Bacilli bacterium]|nr:zinc ribbon domain-containing protein [Bacilli bacterium]
MNQCDKCGAILGRDEIVCKNCGNPVNNQGFTGYNGSNNFYPGASLKSMVENTGTLNSPQDNYNNNMGNNMFIGNMGGPNNGNNKNSGGKFNLKELGDKKIVIVILIGLLVVALIFVIFGNKIFGGSGDPVDTDDTFELKTPTITNPPIETDPNPQPTPTPQPEPEPTPQPEPEPTPQPEPEPEPEPQPQNYKEVPFENYVFEIPLDYNAAEYEKENRKILYITSKNGNWGGAINLEKGSYNQVVKSKENIKSNYESQGYEVKSIKEQKIGSLTFFVLEIYDDEFGNGLAAFTNAGSNQVFFITLYTDDGKLDYNALGVLSNLIYKAKLRAQGY